MNWHSVNRSAKDMGKWLKQNKNQREMRFSGVLVKWRCGCASLAAKTIPTGQVAAYQTRLPSIFLIPPTSFVSGYIGCGSHSASLQNMYRYIRRYIHRCRNQM